MEESDFKLLSDLMPRYDGNPKLLNMYITNVEKLLALFQVDVQLNTLVVCLIKSRLSGNALDALAFEKTLDTWSQIKDALQRRLGDPRNEIQVMQELTRTRRIKSEDSETYGKRLREVLETLYTVGKNPKKDYYEQMVIEQYINQLEFHVSLGVRINKPETLEAAILAARQEEARLACNPPPSLIQQKPRVDLPRIGNPSRQYAFNNNNLHPQYLQTQMQPQPNWYEQRPRPRQQMLPWKQNQGNYKPNTNSGNYRSSGNYRQPNIPHSPVNQPQEVSDVTMRSVNKPPTRNFGQQDLFYMPQEQLYTNPTPQEYYAEGGECSYSNYQDGGAMYDGEYAQETDVDRVSDFPTPLEEKDLS